ncbi:MAG: aminoacyl-histidine dipeptidase [Candidatus Amulumruptor caecigallinarius]|nr:aminoacyl-histidine dipeptidase [Candidatus Amulumruptor caecigallinarius]
MKITDLNPKLVWEIFDEITKVPRPTHHLDKMKEFLVAWAERHNIEVHTDEVGNVMMRVPATPGHENAPVIILQGHQDMVAEKLPEVKHDFMTDPIKTVVDGEWVRAEGTTLGADNGLGCATAMACLIDPDIVHGPLEALLTVDEEQGLIGANGLQKGFVTGKTLLNLDSEEMGSLVIGCAGGKVTICSIPVTKQPSPANLKFYKVEIGGLKGGHSGMEINLGRANANVQLARFLWEADRINPVELAFIDGGGLANAIPRDAMAVVGVSEDACEAFLNYAVEFNKTIHAEFAAAENADFFFTVKEEKPQSEIIESQLAHNLISAIFACPNGVQTMSAAIPGLVETSDNLASVKMLQNNTIEITVHQRSSVDSRRDEIADRVSALFSMIGAEVKFDDSYPGWKPNPNSKVLKVAEECYEELFHCKPKVEALHAGLECGLFLEKMPDLDMVSFGPTLKDIHSPGEKANIKTVQEFYELLKDMLGKLA